MPQKTNPIKHAEEVQQNPDPHIDQDFPGYPHLPSDKKSITPVTTTEKNWRVYSKRKSRKKLMVDENIMYHNSFGNTTY